MDNIAIAVAEFACTVGNNDNNATLTVDTTAITGGSGTYVRYEFIEEDDPNTPAVEAPSVVQNGNSPVFTETDRAGGVYTVNVYDANGCAGTAVATILPFDELLTANATITNTVTCTPGNDGELTVLATTSLADPSRLSYSLDNGVTFQPSNTFSGLSAGAYTVLVRHLDTGCEMTATATLEEPNTFTIDVDKTADVVCFGSATGAVNFSLVDATYPGGFDWEIFDTNGTLADTSDDLSVATGNEGTNGPTADIPLSAGSYYVAITQDNNPFCLNTAAFTIDGPSADITATEYTEAITCAGNDGVIEIIDVLGGWGDYTYFVGTAAPAAPTDFVPSPRFGNLASGTYQAWVRDREGCERMVFDNTVLVDPMPISAVLQVTQDNCSNFQGALEVTAVTGGQGNNYTYQLLRNGVALGGNQTTTTFSGLGAGSYEVLITDQWSCSFTTSAVLLFEEMNSIASVTKEMDCTTTPDGTITVNVTGGSTNLSFEATYPDGMTTATNTTGVFTGLDQAGTYTFVVSDLDTASLYVLVRAPLIWPRPFCHPYWRVRLLMLVVREAMMAVFWPIWTR